MRVNTFINVMISRKQTTKKKFGRIKEFLAQILLKLLLVFGFGKEFLPKLC